MRRLLITFVGSISLLLLAPAARAQEIPGDCMASFNVKPNKASTNITWTLATGQSAEISCGAAAVLRENLFIAGDKRLTTADLSTSPEAAHRRALEAYAALEAALAQLPGTEVSGQLFAGQSFVIYKYLLASCLLTLEAGGGTCWLAAIKFAFGTYKFLQVIAENRNAQLNKQQLIARLRELKPNVTNVTLGPADPSGARARWVQMQIGMCRAIQKDCL